MKTFLLYLVWQLISIFYFPVLAQFGNSINAKNKSRDLRNNTFINPVLSGDFPDPSILRDGKDYYLTCSAFDYLPGLTIFHSRDLVNWKPVSYALTAYLGSGWAPDICKYNGKYYIYFTVAEKGNYVVCAESPNGPWSIPVNLNVGWLDPCHIVDEQNRRWLFLSGGHRIRLSDDGLSTIGELEKVYDGWTYPEEWETEGLALEGPKVKKIGQYYYMLSAEGGTAGPPTSHMVVVARSRSINGPWENSPNNPLIHTYKRVERWWSKGHGSLIDGPDGKWWIIYHAYENGFSGLGRQVLLEPIELTSDGWLKAPTGRGIENPIPSPAKSDSIVDRLAHLNEFRIGLDWRFYKQYDTSRFLTSSGVLTLKAQGHTPQESSPVLFVAGAHDYEFRVRIDKDSNAVAGLVLFYNSNYYVGTGFDNKQILSWRKGEIKGRHDQLGKNRLWLKIRNNNNIVTGFYSYDGVNWKQEPWSRDISGYYHNVLYDFISILPGLFAYGEGLVRFSEFEFKRLN